MLVNSNTSDLEASLAAYIQVLTDSANHTHWAPDRPVFQSHLAQAARMFAALRGDRPIEALMAIVAEERHNYGWGYGTRKRASDR
jgi:hypothetical protein